jgi:hypothetical protein
MLIELKPAPPSSIADRLYRLTFAQYRAMAAADYPNVGSNVIKLRPPEQAMLPVVMLPRPLQESNVIGKAGNAGFLGKAYDG